MSPTASLACSPEVGMVLKRLPLAAEARLPSVVRGPVERSHGRTLRHCCRWRSRSSGDHGRRLPPVSLPASTRRGFFAVVEGGSMDALLQWIELTSQFVV